MTSPALFVNLKSMSNKIKLAIIGLGHLGAYHLKTLDQMQEHIDLVAVCDVKKDRAVRLARQYDVPFVKDYKKIVDQVDAVDICVPTKHHHTIAKYFLERGKHTFIEKPISTTVEEANELVALAEKNNLKLQVGHIERFNAAFESIKHFTKQPLFIECHRMNNFPNRSLDIGVIMDLMIHDIDIILGICKSPIADISAVGVNVLTKLEDIASVRLTLESGCVCNLTASRVSEEVMRKIRIFQPKTYISLDYVKQEAYIYKKHLFQILKHSLPIEKELPLTRELDHFIDCIKNDRQPIVSGIEGRDALKVALQITDQIWKRNKQILSS